MAKKSSSTEPINEQPELEPPTISDTREMFRRYVIERVANLAELKLLTMESGPLEGLKVISAESLRAAMIDAGTEPLPRFDSHTGEVAAGHDPAYVVVNASCPRCGIPQALAATISPQLVVDANKAELKLKAKSAARPHVCGQLPLPITDEAGTEPLPEGASSAEDIIEESTDEEPPLE